MLGLHLTAIKRLQNSAGFSVQIKSQPPRISNTYKKYLLSLNYENWYNLRPAYCV